VQNLRASAEFYAHVIGLDTIPEPFHDGKHAWFSLGAGVSLHVIEGAEQKRDYYKNQHTCLSVPSVDDFVAKLKASQLTWEDRDGVREAITTRVDGVKQIWLQDPDGYWIEINDARE
jgi:lactoylglutathione lyase